MTWCADDIKALRATLGLTQEALAQEITVSVTTICRWESGRTKPSRHTSKLLDALAGKDAT